MGCAASTAPREGPLSSSSAEPSDSSKASAASSAATKYDESNKRHKLSSSSSSRSATTSPNTHHGSSSYLTNSSMNNTRSNNNNNNNHSDEDEEGPLSTSIESANAPLSRKGSLTTVTSTRGQRAASSTTTPRLSARMTEPRQAEVLGRSAPPPDERAASSSNGSGSPRAGGLNPGFTTSASGNGDASNNGGEMFVFGDFNVDPQDVKRQRIERLNRIARPAAMTLRRRSHGTDGGKRKAVPLGGGSDGSGGASESTSDNEDTVFVLNDFVIKVLDHDVDDSETARYTFLHEIKVPAGFKQLRSFGVHPLMGSPLRVKSVALLADEQTFLVSSVEDTAPLLMSTSTGAEVSCFVGHSNAITSITVSRDGKLIATCSRDNSVCIWDAPGVKDNSVRKQIRTLVDRRAPTNAAPWSAAFTHDASCVVVGHQDGVCRSWDISGRDEMIICFMEEHALKKIVFCVDCHPRELICASGSGDKHVLVWNVLDATVIRRLLGHELPVHTVKFSADGDKILSADSKCCHLWDTASGQCLLGYRLTDYFTPKMLNPMATAATLNSFTFGSPPSSPKNRRSPKGGHSTGAAPQSAIAAALCGPHTVARSLELLGSNGQTPAITCACFAPGVLANSYVCIGTSLSTVIVAEQVTGREELRLPTKAGVYCLSSGRDRTVIVGDTFGNVYRVELIA